MTSEIDIWRSANVLVRDHQENAGVIAADRLALMQRREDKAGMEVWRRIIHAVDAIVTAVRNSEREPALYFRFSFPNELSDEEIQQEMWRHEGRADYGFDGFDDLPRDPLIVLTAKAMEDAKAEAELLWEMRNAFLSDKHMPTGWCIFNEIGCVLDFYETSQDN